MKYNIDDTLVVYDDAPTFIGGAIVKVIERDPNDGSYSVASLEDVYDVQGDTTKLIERSSKWVKEHDVYPISYKRPTGLVYKIKSSLKRLFSKDFKFKVKLFIRKLQFWKKIED